MIYNLPATPASLQFDEVFFQPAMTVLHDYCRQEQTNGGDNCLQMYRVTYRDPHAGSDFVFLITHASLPPGVVALLYQLRWKIEKHITPAKVSFISPRIGPTAR